MSQEITMPSFGSSMGEANLLRWLVGVGDAVKAGQVIAEIETEKAVAELEAPADGVIESIEVDAGTEAVEVGRTLARLQRAVSGDEDLPAGAPEPRTISTSGTSEPATPGRAKSTLLASLGYDEGFYDLKPLDDMRRAIARRLVESVNQAPHYSLTADLVMDRAVARLGAINSAAGDGMQRVGVNDLIVHACARALLDVPEVNASFTPDGIALHRHANIAVAVAIEGGLVTPVVRRVEELSIEAVAAVLRDLVLRAREGRLKQSELEGGTFSISNLGMTGIRSFTSILNPPQAGILSVGKMRECLVVQEGQTSIAKIMTVTLTCDHRVIDGMTGAVFLQKLQAHLDGQ